MRILRKGAKNGMERTIQTVGRPLEASLVRWLFTDGKAEDVIKELVSFQNPDGGFGHGLESDFRLPDSSPLATSVGIRILLELPEGNERNRMMDAAFSYLEEAYVSERGGWYAVPLAVMDYPHAPWWSINQETGHTAIDESWGNPTAEILSQFLKAGRQPDVFDLHRQVLFAVGQLEEKQEYVSEHELYCYLSLYDALEGEMKIRLEETLTEAIHELIRLDPEDWEEYVPTPLHFLDPKRASNFGISSADLNQQLDWLVCKMEKKGGWMPPWGDSFYSGELKVAYHEWIGVLTLKALKWLKAYGRIERENNNEDNGELERGTASRT
jgi:hypothetical protein